MSSLTNASDCDTSPNISPGLVSISSRAKISESSYLIKYAQTTFSSSRPREWDKNPRVCGKSKH